MRQPFLLLDLPADLLRALLLGFSGRTHLSYIADIALKHSTAPGDNFSLIAQDALLAAWGENPFDGYSLAALVGNMERLPPLSGVVLGIIKSVLSNWKPEVSPEAKAAMAGGRDEQLFS